jgi:hypothetical protein
MMLNQMTFSGGEVRLNKCSIYAVKTCLHYCKNYDPSWITITTDCMSLKEKKLKNYSSLL